MTPTEFRQLAERWPSVPTLAADLGVTRYAVYHWMRGERPVPENIARFIRVLANVPEAHAYLRQHT